MKRIVVSLIIVSILTLWVYRYHEINNGFSVHGEYPEIITHMHDKIEFAENKSYNLYEAPGYSISVEKARIIDTDDYLKELNMDTNEFEFLSEKYLEITLTVQNNGDYQGGLSFYGLPIVGENWYSFYDNQLTACINPFFENDFDLAHGCTVSKGETATVKIAYNLYKQWFLPRQWENIENDNMWLSVTIMPVDTKVKIEL